VRLLPHFGQNLVGRPIAVPQVLQNLAETGRGTPIGLLTTGVFGCLRLVMSQVNAAIIATPTIRGPQGIPKPPLTLVLLPPLDDALVSGTSFPLLISVLAC
jgi:hypothetical protein